MTSTCDSTADPEACTNPASSLGLCRKHYMRLRRANSTELTERRIAAASRVPDVVPCAARDIHDVPCTAVAAVGPFCTKHDHRMKQYGDVRIARIYPVNSSTPGRKVRMDTVKAYEMRRDAAAGTSLLALATMHALPLDYVAALVGSDTRKPMAWHSV